MLARFKPQRKKWFHKDSGHLLRWSIFLHVTGVDFIVGCRDSAPVDQFGTRNRSYRSIVRSVAFLVQRCLTVNQHNTVVQGKYIAATSWLCVLLDNTTVDNVFIHLDIKLTCIEAKSDWLNENDELRMKRLFFFMETVAMLSCSSLAKIQRQCPKLSMWLAGSHSSSALW